MNGSKYLAKNMGLMTISQFGTKLLSFFLVPLYTNVLSTAEYGTYDLFNSTVSLMIPILTLNICDSSLRFSIDNENDNKDVFSISIFHFFVSVLIIAGIIVLNKWLNVIPMINDYAQLFFWLFCATALNGILTYFARGIDCVKEVAISGIISSLLMLSLNILFLLPMHMGLLGYFLANIIAIMGQTIYLCVAIKGWKYCKVNKFNSRLHKNMLKYSEPMIVNNIAWWINNVSDRYIVTWFCGIAANGIYSVSYKIPSILNIFQSIFNQAWTLSAVKDFDPEDKNNFFSTMYNIYNICMVIVCSFLILTSRIIAHLLYAKDFFEAWKCVPFLLIAVVFGASAGYLGGIFGAVKDTKVFAESTLVSACTNIILNFVLVSQIGTIGAAIATAIAYLLTWVIRIIKVRKYIALKLNIKKDFIAYFILVLQSLFLFVFSDGIIYYSIEGIFFILLILIYNREIKLIYRKTLNFLEGQLHHAKH